jgi:hypothetical protein
MTATTATTNPSATTTKLSFLARHASLIVLLASTAVSLATFAWLYLHGQQNLGDYDAIARLNIARKILDSNAPGFGQLGGIWLPFPQILFIPLIWSDFLWRSGIAGAVVSMTAFVAGAYFLYRTVFMLTRNQLAATIAWLAYVSNVNLLMLQTMAMSESFFLTGIIMVVYSLTKWVTDKKLSSLLLAAFFVMIVTLTRYEGYAVLLASLVTVLLSMRYLRTKKDAAGKTEGIFINLPRPHLLAAPLFRHQERRRRAARHHHPSHQRLRAAAQRRTLAHPRRRRRHLHLGHGPHARHPRGAGRPRRLPHTGRHHHPPSRHAPPRPALPAPHHPGDHHAGVRHLRLLARPHPANRSTPGRLVDAHEQSL